MDTAPIPLATLLAHRDWVRTVARAVVRDENAADDIEQDTWLAAIETPPRHDGSLRGWFGAVVRSKAQRAARTAERRAGRELAAARDDVSQSAADLVETADTHRRVVEAVVDLDEPYRTTILLRFFEGFAVAEVAARTGVPLETARARLRRGVERLRERLSRELGTSERSWHAALAPLLLPTKRLAARGGVGTKATGGLVMAASTKAVVAGVIVVALAVGGGLWWKERGPVGVDPPFSGASVSEEPSGTPSTSGGRARLAVDPVAPTPASDAAPPGAENTRTVAERLLDKIDPIDLSDDPLGSAFARLAEDADVPIVISSEAAAVIASDAQAVQVSLDGDVTYGRAIELLAQLSGLSVVVEEARVVVVPADGKWDPSGAVIVPPTPASPQRLSIVGTVRDAQGFVVGGAEVVRIPMDRIRTTTDASGRFEFKVRPPYGSLEARARGQRASFAVPVIGDTGSQITLDLALRGPAGSVVVHVTSDTGPVAGATVSAGPTGDAPATLADGRAVLARALSATTDRDGNATIAGVPPGKVVTTARLRGHADATTTVSVTALAATSVELRLTRKPSLEDRLLTARTSLTLSDTLADDAFSFLGQCHDVSIVVAPDARHLTSATTVTLESKGQSLADSLRDICAAIGGVTYEVNGEVVIIRLIAK